MFCNVKKRKTKQNKKPNSNQLQSMSSYTFYIQESTAFTSLVFALTWCLQPKVGKLLSLWWCFFLSSSSFWRLWL